MVGFKSDIVQWVAKVGNRTSYLPSESAKVLLKDVRVPVKEGGNMPVLTGNLRNSVEVSFTGAQPANKILDPDKPLKDPTAALNAKLARARPGVIISIFFRAIYGPPMELKYGFVRLSAQRWAQHVNQALTALKRLYP